MFRPNWPSSGIQVVMVKDSAAGHLQVYRLLWLTIVLLTGHLQVYRLLWLTIVLLTGHLQVYRLLWLRILLLPIFRCTGCYG
jgi:hypothetical protein